MLPHFFLNGRRVEFRTESEFNKTIEDEINKNNDNTLPQQLALTSRRLLVAIATVSFGHFRHFLLSGQTFHWWTSKMCLGSGL